MSPADNAPAAPQPEDPTALARLAAAGLRYALVDTIDAALFGAWIQADTRGFLGARMTPEEERWFREGTAFRRTVGVYDDTVTTDAGVPIATTQSWLSELTVPGSSRERPRSIPSWAISGVTVSPTHRRRGVARQLLEGELRTAAASGISMAMLTVSESTIYGRFGFAPAAFVADWVIDTRRSAWIGPDTTAFGRIEFVSIELWRQEVAALHERTRFDSPGDILVWGLRWDQVAGLTSTDEARSKEVRAIHFLDREGVTRGVALYRMSGGDPDFAHHTVNVEKLVAETAEAESALWRFLLELDLTHELRAPLRRVEEPLRWQIADFRAAHVDVWEHQYLRVLDVAAVLEARGYLATGSLVLQVSDPLGYTTGVWRLDVSAEPSAAESSAADLSAAVTRLDAVPDDIPALALTANELAAIYLGGVSVATLVEAGRIAELTPGAAVAADGLLRVARAPWLSVWY